MHNLPHEFTDRKVSPWGGIKFFQQTFESSGTRDFLKQLPLPVTGSNRGYPAIDLIEGFLTSVILGSRRLEHSGMLRTDEVVRKIFDWKKGMASASTFSRFFGKFDLKRNNEIFPALMKHILSTVQIKHMTVDIDSTVITRYGHQEGAAIGYNPKKRGMPSHHPLLAFCDELKMVINAWMRPGNSDDKTVAVEFLHELFEIISPEQIGLLRGDVGFYSHNIMSLLEQRNINYIFRAKMTASLLQEILANTRWHSNSDIAKGAAYAEIDHTSEKWKKKYRRIIVVRTPKINKPLANPELFEDLAQINEYEYSAFITHSNFSAVEVHRRYNQRGESENRIKELKYDYAIDGFALKSFPAMEAAFRFIMVAFNIMTIFKQAIMLSRKNHRLSTIKFQCIAIGSYLISSGRKIKMKLSAEGKRRHFLQHLFENLEVIRPPFRFSNA
jgi:hypothetical protein